MQAFKNILIGFAFSPNLKANVNEALRMAFFFDAELTFVHVGEKTLEKETRFKVLLQSCPIQPKKFLLTGNKENPYKHYFKLVTILR
jgi:nucleotide-binding universal stress UspA family protein